MSTALGIKQFKDLVVYYSACALHLPNSDEAICNTRTCHPHPRRLHHSTFIAGYLEPYLVQVWQFLSPRGWSSMHCYQQRATRVAQVRQLTRSMRKSCEIFTPMEATPKAAQERCCIMEDVSTNEGRNCGHVYSLAGTLIAEMIGLRAGLPFPRHSFRGFLTGRRP